MNVTTREVVTSPAERIPARKSTIATQTMEVSVPPTQRREYSRRTLNATQRLRKRALALERESRSRTAVKIVEASIKSKFGQGLSQPELLVIARFVSQTNGIPIDRDATRRKASLLSWCAENMDDFHAVLAQTTGRRRIMDCNLEEESDSDTS